MKRALSIGITIALLAGYTEAAQVKDAPATTRPAAPSPAGETAPNKHVRAGKIVETMNAAGYTYICLEKNGVKSWSVVPKTTVKVGQVVEVLPGMPMVNFTSKELNRSFAIIMFSDGLAAKK